MFESNCIFTGKEFESLVAEKLKSTGFKVYRDLTMPWKPGSDKFTQIDMIAVYDTLVLTIECKSFNGKISGRESDSHWTWTLGEENREVSNPFKQSTCHVLAISANLGCEVDRLIVIADHTICETDQKCGILRYEQLDDAIPVIKTVKMNRAGLPSNFDALCNSWANPPEEVRADHLAFVNFCKNSNVMESINKGENVLKYCIVIDGKYFYIASIEDHIWGTDKIEEAKLYCVANDANDDAVNLPNADVCILTERGLEYLREIEEELARAEEDDMTPQEYADIVGARPW